MRQTIGSIVSSRELRVLFSTLALAYVAQASLFQFLPLYMEQQFSPSKLVISSAFALMAAAEIPAMIYLGAVSDKVGRKRILALCLIAYPVRTGLTVLLPEALGVVLVQMLHGLTFGGLLVVSTAYISDVTPETIRGASLGLYPIAQNLGLIAGGYITGVLIDWQGFVSMYLIMTAYAAIPVLLFAVLAKETVRFSGLPART